MLRAAPYALHVGLGGFGADGWRKFIHVNPERSFGGTNGEPPSEASQLRKGGRGVPPENFKNLHCKWGNLRYIYL